MKIYIFEKNKTYGTQDTFIIVAHSEDEAWFLLTDYDSEYDIDMEDYTLIGTKPFNMGIVAHIVG